MTQMTIYDLLHQDRINPIRAVIRQASPYWTKSRHELIELCRKNPMPERWKWKVHKEYCPYGLAGHYGSGNGPNSIVEYDMKTKDIYIEYIDMDGIKKSQICSWADFAEELRQMILEGEYREE